MKNSCTYITQLTFEHPVRLHQAEHVLQQRRAGNTGLYSGQAVPALKWRIVVAAAVRGCWHVDVQALVVVAVLVDVAVQNTGADLAAGVVHWKRNIKYIKSYSNYMILAQSKSEKGLYLLRQAHSRGVRSAARYASEARLQPGETRLL